MPLKTMAITDSKKAIPNAILKILIYLFIYLSIYLLINLFIYVSRISGFTIAESWLVLDSLLI